MPHDIKTFYTASFAPNPQLVDLVIRLKKLDIPKKEVNILAAENRSPEMLKLNPAGQLPFFELATGEIIADTIAMCEYLEETEPTAPAMFGKTAGERAHTRMWQRRMEEHFVYPTFTAFRFWTASDDAEGSDFKGFFNGKAPVLLPEAWKGMREWALTRLVWLEEQKSLGDGRAHHDGGNQPGDEQAEQDERARPVILPILLLLARLPLLLEPRLFRRQHPLLEIGGHHVGLEFELNVFRYQGMEEAVTGAVAELNLTAEADPGSCAVHTAVLAMSVGAAGMESTLRQWSADLGVGVRLFRREEAGGRDAVVLLGGVGGGVQACVDGADVLADGCPVLTLARLWWYVEPLPEGHKLQRPVSYAAASYRDAAELERLVAELGLRTLDWGTVMFNWRLMGTLERAKSRPRQSSRLARAISKPQRRKKDLGGALLELCEDGKGARKRKPKVKPK